MSSIDQDKRNNLEISSELSIFQNQYLKLSRVNAKIKGIEKEYFVTNFGRRAAMILHKNNSILLVNQFRHLINRSSWEIPGGRVEESESPETGAIRECLEETGLLAQNAELLINYEQGLDSLHNPTYVYQSDTFKISNEFEPNVAEVEKYNWIKIVDCLEMIKTKEILDSLTIISILTFNLFYLRNGIM
ncbi:MAG: NUDIX hydrolase [Nitrospinota bacterium]|nr:NUDIX hydrolase [Nitrospinota bacterium]